MYNKKTKTPLFKGLADLIGAAVGGYLVYAARTWLRYGRNRAIAVTDPTHDPLLDIFMPEFDVRDRHEIHVAASAEKTLQAARDMDFDQSILVSAIFKARELILKGEP